MSTTNILRLHKHGNKSINVVIEISSIQVFNVLKQMWRSKKIQFRRSNADGGQRNSSSSQVASSMGESITNNTFTTSNAKISAETMC